MPAIIKQYEGSVVSPKDDATLYRIFNEESGVIRGCALTYLGANQIRVDAGYVYICGRLVEIEEEVVLSPFSAEEGAAGELILKVDLLSDTPARLLARTPRQELVQEDINAGGEAYEYLIASYMVSDVAISGLTVEYEVISAGFSKDKILKTVNEVSAVTEEGFLADALVVKELNANFQGAADAIGDAISGLGVAVPEGATLLEMAEIISSKLYAVPTYQSGTVTIHTKFDGAPVEKLINFDLPFSKPPTISILSVNSSPNYVNRGNVSIPKVTASSFTCKVTPPRASVNEYLGVNISVTVTWEAL